MRSSHGCQHPGPQTRRGDQLEAVLLDSLHRTDRPDRRRRARAGQELAGSGDAPTAVRVVADPARACHEQRLTQHLGVLGRNEYHPFVQRRTEAGGFEYAVHGQAQRLGQRVGNARVGGIGVGVGGEQRSARTDEPVDQRPLGGARRDSVDTPQQQRMVRHQQPGRTHRVDHRVGGVDGQCHRFQLFVRIPADQTDGVPVVRQLRRVGLVQHSDDLTETNTHRSTSATALTNVGHSGRTVARR